MRTFSRIFLGLAAFLLLGSGTYALHAQEYEGVLLSLSVMAGAVLVGVLGTFIVRRAQTQLIANGATPGTAGDDEAHVGPTIWPLVFALSSAILVVGTVANRWALVPGAAVFLGAAGGWIVDVRRQWHHHAQTHRAAESDPPTDGGGHDGFHP